MRRLFAFAESSKDKGGLLLIFRRRNGMAVSHEIPMLDKSLGSGQKRRIILRLPLDGHDLAYKVQLGDRSEMWEDRSVAKILPTLITTGKKGGDYHVELKLDLDSSLEDRSAVRGKAALPRCISLALLLKKGSDFLGGQRSVLIHAVEPTARVRHSSCFQRSVVQNIITSSTARVRHNSGARFRRAPSRYPGR